MTFGFRAIGALLIIFASLSLSTRAARAGESDSALSRVPAGSNLVFYLPSYRQAVKDLMAAAGKLDRVFPVTATMLDAGQQASAAAGIDLSDPDSFAKAGLDADGSYAVALVDGSVLQIVLPYSDRGLFEQGFVRTALQRAKVEKKKVKGVDVRVLKRLGAPAMAIGYAKKHVVVCLDPEQSGKPMEECVANAVKLEKSFASSPELARARAKLGKHMALVHLSRDILEAAAHDSHKKAMRAIEASKKAEGKKADPEMAQNRKAMMAAADRERDQMLATSKAFREVFTSITLGLETSASGIAIRSVLGLVRSGAGDTSPIGDALAKRGKTSPGKAIAADAIAFAKLSADLTTLARIAIVLSGPEGVKEWGKAVEEELARSGFDLDRDMLELVGNNVAIAVYETKPGAVAAAGFEESKLEHAVEAVMMVEIDSPEAADGALQRLVKSLELDGEKVKVTKGKKHTVYTLGEKGVQQLAFARVDNMVVAGMGTRFDQTLALLEGGDSAVLSKLDPESKKRFESRNGALFLSVPTILSAVLGDDIPSAIKRLLIGPSSPLGSFLQLTLDADTEGVVVELALPLK